MRKTWNLIPMIAFAVVAMFLVVSAPSVVLASDVVADQPIQVDNSAMVASTAAVNSEVKGFQRLSESPGGAYVAITNSEKVITCQKSVPSGGAVGSANFGIRGVTHKS